MWPLIDSGLAVQLMRLTKNILCRDRYDGAGLDLTVTAFGFRQPCFLDADVRGSVDLRDQRAQQCQTLIIGQRLDISFNVGKRSGHNSISRPPPDALPAVWNGLPAHRLSRAPRLDS